MEEDARAREAKIQKGLQKHTTEVKGYRCQATRLILATCQCFRGPLNLGNNSIQEQELTLGTDLNYFLSDLLY